jgi:hypothetical protein
VPNQVEQVRAQQAVPARQDQDRVRTPEPCDLLDEVPTRGRIEFTGERVCQRGGPAVPAGDSAGPGGLPEDEHRPLAVVDL